MDWIVLPDFSNNPVLFIMGVLGLVFVAILMLRFLTTILAPGSSSRDDDDDDFRDASEVSAPSDGPPRRSAFGRKLFRRKKRKGKRVNPADLDLEPVSAPVQETQVDVDLRQMLEEEVPEPTLLENAVFQQVGVQGVLKCAMERVIAGARQFYRILCKPEGQVAFCTVTGDQAHRQGADISLGPVWFCAYHKAAASSEALGETHADLAKDPNSPWEPRAPGRPEPMMEAQKTTVPYKGQPYGQ